MISSINPVFSGFWGQLPEGFFALAPMEDVTDFVFREVLRAMGGPQVYFTEFAMASGIARKARDSLARVTFHPEEYPVVAQIWGNNPEDYKKAVYHLRRAGFHGVDINMGCPQHGITAKGCCSALIKNPVLAGELIQAALEAAQDSGPEARALGLGQVSGVAGGPIPVSVKTRVSFQHPPSMPGAESWFRTILAHPLAAFTVHGRSAEQQSEGLADWTYLDCAREVRNELNPKTKLLGNGDVLSLEQGRELAARHGLDGIMVGRGLFSNPLLFSGKFFSDLSSSEKLYWAGYHLDLYESHWGTNRNYEIMKKFFKIYLQDFTLMDGRDADTVRAEIMETHSYTAARDVLAKALSASGNQGGPGSLLLT